MGAPSGKARGVWGPVDVAGIKAGRAPHALCARHIEPQSGTPVRPPVAASQMKEAPQKITTIVFHVHIESVHVKV